MSEGIVINFISYWVVSQKLTVLTKFWKTFNFKIIIILVNDPLAHAVSQTFAKHFESFW